MATKKKLHFEASARLQRLIGPGLVPNDEMAIVELVKNAYDSGARNVLIFIQPDRAKEPGLIRISDDGEGMSEDEIRRLFMFAGYSERAEQTQSAKRTPTGEKGIGRFAAAKLGRTLDVFTAKASNSGVHLSIDWSKFDVKGTKKFSDITATYNVGSVASVLPHKSGTVLEIRKLTTKWDSSQVERLTTWLGDLLNPFSKPKDFSIQLEVAGTARGAVRIDPTPPDGDISMELTISGEKVQRLIREKGKKTPIVDAPSGSSGELGPLRGLHARFVHFDQKPKKMQTHGLVPGVRVYRDGFRIEPFGSRSSDWLGVAEQRAKRAGHAHVVPNRLFGFVEISRKRNPELGDTTSRQALLDTEAARNLVTVLREGLSSLGDVLRTRTEPRWKENRRRKQVELEQARLHTLGEVASGLAHELRQPLQSIRTEADNIREKLSKLGINDSDVVESQEAIDRGIVRINKNISLVSELSKGNLTDLTRCDLAEILKNELAVFSTRCAPLGIQISLRAPAAQPALINELAVSIVVINCLQNAMDSIEASGGTSIVVSLRKHNGVHRIEIEDDGQGVPVDVLPHLFTKFATKKTGGMGVGLHFCRILVESHSGRIGHLKKGKLTTFWVELPEG